MADNNLETAKQQVAQARQQLEQERQKVAEQRKQIEQGRIEAKKQEELLLQTKEKLPKRATQRALRQTMGGLQGRIKRREIKKTEEKIGGEIKKVEEFKSGLSESENVLSEYEQSLSKYEQEQLVPVEAEIRRVEEYNRAVKAVKKAADRGVVWAIAAWGEGLERKLAKEYLEKERLAEESFRKQVQEFELKNPSENLIIDWKNLRIKGVESGALGQSLSWNEYNKKIKELEELQPKEISLSSEISPTQLEGIKSNALIQPKIVSFGIPLVSAKSQDINISGGLNQNVSRIPSGIPNGMDRGSNLISSIGTGISSFVDDIFKGHNEGKKEGLQTGITGGVISAYDPTEKFTPYTLPEKTFLQKIGDFPGIALASAREFSADVAALSSAEKNLGLGNVGAYSYRTEGGDLVHKEVTSFGIPVAKLEEVKKIDKRLNVNIPKINELDVQIKELESKNQLDKNYEELINKRNKLYEQIREDQSRREEISQVKIGLFQEGGATTDISRFSGYPITTSFSLFTSGVEGTVENIAFLGGKKDIGRPYNVTTEQRGTIQTDSFTGKEMPFYKTETGRLEVIDGKLVFVEYKITEEDVRKRAEFAGNVAGVTSGIALLSVPYIGAGYNIGMTAETLVPYGFSPSRFWSESTPTEKINVGLALGTGALTVTRIILKNVPRAKYAGLTKEQYIKFLEKAGQDASKLDDANVKWISIEDKGNGIVELVGEQAEGGLSRRIRIGGKLSKSELDKIILSGVGEYETTGVVLFGEGGRVPKSFGFAEAGIFETGARGKAFPIGDIGNIQVLKQVGTGTTIPKISTRFGFQTGISGKKAFKQASEQVSENIFLGGDISKNIEERILLKFNEDVALSVGNKDVGVILKKKPTSMIFDLETGGTLKITPTGETGSRIISRKKTPLSKTFQELKVEDLSLITPPPAPKSQTTITKTETGLFPLVSARVETGTYEKTKQVSPQLVSVEPAAATISRTITPTRITGFIRQPVISKEEQRIRTGFREIQRQEIRPTQEVSISLKPSTAQATKQSQVQRSEQATAQESLLGKPRPTTKPTTSRMFRIFKTKFDDFRKEKRTKEENLFRIFGRRRGEFREIGTAKSKEEAKEIFLGFQKGTLGRSAFIEEDGRKLSIEELGLDTSFRPSKELAGVIVQRKEKALGTFGERTEIKRARKSQKVKWI